MARGERPSPEDEPAWDARGVHFIVGADDDNAELDEELPEPDPDKARARRLRTELGIGALGLIVALLIVRGLTGSSSAPTAAGSDSPGSPAATGPASVAPGPTPTGPLTPPPYLYRGNLPPALTTPASTPHPAFPKHIPRRHGNDPRACPGLRCSSSIALPASVSDAIQTAFPESTVERTQTVRLRGGGHVLWFREVVVRAGEEQLTLRVQAPTTSDRTSAGQRSVNGQRTTFVQATLGPWHVEVDVLDLLGGQPPQNRLVELAHDPRIASG